MFFICQHYNVFSNSVNVISHHLPRPDSLLITMNIHNLIKYTRSFLIAEDFFFLRPLLIKARRSVSSLRNLEKNGKELIAGCVIWLVLATNLVGTRPYDHRLRRTNMTFLWCEGNNRMILWHEWWGAARRGFIFWSWRQGSSESLSALALLWYGAGNVFRRLQKHAQPPKVFFFVSSTSVYGQSPKVNG